MDGGKVRSKTLNPAYFPESVMSASSALCSNRVIISRIWPGDVQILPGKVLAEINGDFVDFFLHLLKNFDPFFPQLAT